MKMSRRAKRMERNHKKSKTTGLNLVALMDIFTVLVFFLLISSSNSQNLPSNKDLKLPISTSMVVPEETLIIAITQEDVLINGVSVAKVTQVLSNADDIIPELKEELLFLAGNSHDFMAGATGEKDGHKVTIMGDENISYDLIRKILTTCQQANYTKIAFAAVQKNRTGA